MARLVFITGASSGLGQALALQFYRSGYRLALAARRTAEISAWVTSNQLQTDRLHIYQADVTRPASIAVAAQQCIQNQGLPDVVLACAGMSVGVDTAEPSDLDVMQKTWMTNNLGTAATFGPFIKSMVARKRGILMGLGSVNGIRGLAGHGANCPSKAAMINYLECLRLELRGHGIKVVTICPGYVATPLTQGNSFSMPFLLQPAEFAEQAQRAVEAGVSYRVIPWQMGVVAKALRIMPNWLFDRLLSGRKRKPRAIPTANPQGSGRQ